MKVLFVIDHFGSGGAQLQLVNLAIYLKKRNYDVQFFIYHPQHIFFRQFVEENGIPIHEHNKKSDGSISLIRRLVTLVNREKYSIVVSYLTTPNIYLELVKILGCKSKIVVSERASFLAEKFGFKLILQRVLHIWADVVVVNSHSQGTWLASKFFWLRGKIKLIYNGIEINKFSNIVKSPDNCKEIKLLAVGRVEHNKNLLNLIKALIIFYNKNGWVPEVRWAGRRDEGTAFDRAYCAEVDALLESNYAVKEKWTWMGERSDVPELLKVSDALIHPSFSEGLPNVICEGLSSSLPVLCSNVCDNGILVEDGKRGFTFDPHSPEEICDSLEKLASLKKDDWIIMSRNSREYAESNLSMERLVLNYEDLFKELTSKAGA